MQLEMDHNDVLNCSIGDHHGYQYNNTRKRGAEDTLEVQSGISNHFKKLRLSTCLHFNPSQWLTSVADHAPAQIHTVERPPPAPAPFSAADNVDLMPVDETPSKVYIHDL